MEVDTPALGQYAITDPNIELFEVSMGDSSRFLQSSPEYAMKRLLAFGSGDIYQLGKVFRSGEHGRKHNPEFAMLEWYRTQWTHYRLMREVADLICPILNLDSWQVWSIEALFRPFLPDQSARRLNRAVAGSSSGAGSGAGWRSRKTGLRRFTDDACGRAGNN
jgi:lysyl-tRNA synthetase class 2